jgi:acetate kinase
METALECRVISKEGLFYPQYKWGLEWLYYYGQHGEEFFYIRDNAEKYLDKRKTKLDKIISKRAYYSSQEEAE